MTGRLEPKEAPAWQRLAFRYLVSFPIIGFCLALVFAVMFAMLQLQVKKNKQTHEEKINFPLFHRSFFASSLSSALFVHSSFNLYACQTHNNHLILMLRNVLKHFVTSNSSVRSVHSFVSN